MDAARVTSVGEFLDFVARDTEHWTKDGLAKPWFRGVTDAKNHKLLPSILRGNNGKAEFKLTKKFRLMAPGYGPTPDTGRLDQWLFLMQHHGAPTRLLDWTESPLVAAFFAAESVAKLGGAEHDAAIYALDPMELNKASSLEDEKGPRFPVTWTQNCILQTIKCAFGTQDEKVFLDGQWRCIHPLERPVALYPSNMHARILSQRACFTLHGVNIRPIEEIFSDQPLILEKHLVKYLILMWSPNCSHSEVESLGLMLRG